MIDQFPISVKGRERSSVTLVILEDPPRFMQFAVRAEKRARRLRPLIVSSVLILAFLVGAVIPIAMTAMAF